MIVLPSPAVIMALSHFVLSSILIKLKSSTATDAGWYSPPQLRSPSFSSILLITICVVFDSPSTPSMSGSLVEFQYAPSSIVNLPLLEGLIDGCHRSPTLDGSAIDFATNLACAAFRYDFADSTAAI